MRPVFGGTRPRRTGPTFALFLIVGAVALAGCGGEDAADPDTEAVPDTTSVEEADPDTAPPAPDSIVPADTTPDPEAPETPTDPRDEIQQQEGIVGVTGTGVAPTATLTLDDGGSLGLTGDLAPELRRLSGARIRVEGRRAATPVGPGLVVSSYHIVEIEGRQPRVGILTGEDDGSWTLVPEGDSALVLDGMPATGVAEGMKIWVVGEPTAGQRFRVESYGIISPRQG